MQSKTYILYKWDIVTPKLWQKHSLFAKLIVKQYNSMQWLILLYRTSLGITCNTKKQYVPQIKHWWDCGLPATINLSVILNRVQCQQITGIKAENKVIKPEQGEWPGEVLITQCWFCGSPVGEGQDWAGCTLAQGQRIPLFVLNLLPVPVLAETNSASVTAIPACGPLSAVTASPPLSYLTILYHFTSVLFHQQYEQQWREHLSGPWPSVYLCWDNVVLPKIWLPVFAVIANVTVTGVMRVTVMGMCVTLQLRWRWFFPPVVPHRLSVRLVVRTTFALSVCISRYSCMRDMLQPSCFLYSLTWEFLLTSAKRFGIW